MTRTVHLSLNIAGFLRNAKFPKEFRGFTDDEGNEMPPAVARDALRLEQARGKRVLPMCDPAECPDFDFDKGCPGHPKEENEQGD
jgi:hypothetical protein